MEIIGLSGYARSGKDEAAKVLVEDYGFTRVAFADKLREVLYALNPIIAEKGASTIAGRYETYVKVQDVIDRHGWDGYKETEYGTEIRRLLQRLGTEAGRETLWDSIWIDAALTGHPDDARIVVTDCRFPNEAQAIKDRGGKVWRIRRPSVGPANNHPSETSLDAWSFDRWISNNGTLEEFRDVVGKVYAKNHEDIHSIAYARPLLWEV